MYRVIFPCPRSLSPKLVSLNNVTGQKQPHPLYTADMEKLCFLTGQFNQMRRKKGQGNQCQTPGGKFESPVV